MIQAFKTIDIQVLEMLGGGYPAEEIGLRLVGCGFAAARHFRLSPTQTRVATLIAARRSNLEIARALCISPNTARRHTEIVMLKLGVTSRLDVETVLRDFQVNRVVAGAR